jgi:hypothetical protein
MGRGCVPKGTSGVSRCADIPTQAYPYSSPSIYICRMTKMAGHFASSFLLYKGHFTKGSKDCSALGSYFEHRILLKFGKCCSRERYYSVGFHCSYIGAYNLYTDEGLTWQMS